MRRLCGIYSTQMLKTNLCLLAACHILEHSNLLHSAFKFCKRHALPSWEFSTHTFTYISPHSSSLFSPLLPILIKSSEFMSYSHLLYYAFSRQVNPHTRKQLWITWTTRKCVTYTCATAAASITSNINDYCTQFFSTMRSYFCSL